ncbi:hypothetical protein HPP92_019218 [Vanilla planifolia]|uniref:Protein kinase domain-containing protein n=1 Tax=Vanilla planifolia TaxID=51239 RepID=A0A835UJ45_VANPL|nr:hypothetical protein HPP92_019218 [Vanilla planifolia]
MADAQVRDVLDFLTRHGFSTAVSALRDDAGSRGIDLASGDAVDDDDSFPPLPPLRTTPGSRGVEGDAELLGSSSSYSSSGDFVSMGTSPSELRNPYGVWSPARPGSSVSSTRHSEFGTAREYNDPSFGESNWYGDQNEGYYSEPYLLPANSCGCQSEDKFVMSVVAEERFLNQEGNGFDYVGKPEIGEGSSGVYGCAFPLCDCCKGNGGMGSSLNPSSSIYGRYQILDDETEMLDEYEEDGAQLKLVDEHTGALPWRSDLGVLDQGKEDKYLESLSVEKNIHLLDEVGDLALTGYSNEVFGKGNNDEKPCSWKASEEEAIDGYNVDKNIHDSEDVRAAVENHDVAPDLQFDAYEEEFETFDLRIVHRKNRTGFEENKDFQIVLNSVIAGRYYLTEYLGSAAFSKVVQAHDLHTGVDVCLKIIKNDKDFFDQSLDEIKLLKYVNKNDPADQYHILRLYDYFYHQEHLFIVCELLRANLYEFQKFNKDSGGEIYFTLHRIQVIARQCLEAIEYLHQLKIVHCDLKPENILIKSYSRCEVKIIDLGSSCFLTDNLCLYVQSRSYRAPEVIIGLPYDEKIDLWSLGCILAELYTGDVLFLNESLVMMLARMIGILGPFDMEMLENGQETHKYFTEDYDLYYKNEETDRIEYLIPEKSSLAHHLQVNDATFLDFLLCLLRTNPKRRLSARQALKHRWFSISYR